MSEKAYSVNGEDFIFEDSCDALDQLYGEGSLVEGQVYYECDTVPIGPLDFMKAYEILESAEDLLCGEIGEVAYDSCSASDDAIAELDALLAAWVDKHLGGSRFWRCVGETRELTVTAEDVASYKSTPASEGGG